MASDLVKVLQPFERATTILSGQQYPTLSLLLPVIAGLRKGLADTLPQECSRTIKNLQAHLTQELGKKFDVRAPASGTALAAAVDPRFRSLLFSKPRWSRHN